MNKRKLALVAVVVAVLIGVSVAIACSRQPDKTEPDASASPSPTVSGCTLSGTYSSSSGLETCSNIVISSLTVPAGTTLNLTNVQNGATITFTGTTTFGTKLWDGPLILVSGSNLKIGGNGTLDGQGAWYWKQGQSVTRPVFIRLRRVNTSTLSDFTIQNSPFRTFSIQQTTATTITKLTLDSSAGDGVAKNTDGFDLSQNDGITISHNVIKNQDDCLAMQSSTNTLFTGNTCSGGHGISVGSIGGSAVDASDTVQGLMVENNTVANSVNGLRIKTIVEKEGVVVNVTYRNNRLVNVQHAIVMHSDYDKAKGGYTGSATSNVGIKGITIAGLSGSATSLYDVLINPSAVADWRWSGITVTATDKGSCQGLPTGVSCA